MVEATSRLISGEERSTMICQLIPSAVPNCKLSLSFKQVYILIWASRVYILIWASRVAGALLFVDFTVASTLTTYVSVLKSSCKTM